MPLTNDFKIKNNLNTLGKILSGGVDIATIFSPSNTSWTLSAVNGTFGVAGGDTLSIQGGNGVDVRVATGTDTVRISGIDATASVKGVASFHADNFLVTNGVVTVKDGGILNAELAGSITDDKLSTISTALKVSNSATTATSANTNNAIVARGASGEFSSGDITSSGTVQAVTVNATTGFRLNNGATSGNVLRGNGTNFVSSAIQAADVPTLNQNTTGSAATLTTGRSLWGQNFNGSANVSGTLSAVGNIIGSGAITLSAGSGNNNINLTPSGTGLVTATGNLSASGTVTGNNIDVKNILSVGAVQVKTVGGGDNLFIGNASTGNNNATGNHNFVFGLAAGKFISSGSNNNFFGFYAGYKNTTGNSNNFLGRKAGYENTTGGSNNFFGNCAGYQTTTGGSNNFLGSNAGYYNTTGSHNNFFGTNAGCTNKSGSSNNFFGYQAGKGNTNVDYGTASHNNIFGTCAGFCNNRGANNNFFGHCAGFSVGLYGGNSNTFIGYKAGKGEYIGSSNNDYAQSMIAHNVAIGFKAGYKISGGVTYGTDYCGAKTENNIFVGYKAGYNSCAQIPTNPDTTVFGDNNFLGFCAGFSNTLGGCNNFFGRSAGSFNRTGSNNIFIGNNANTASAQMSALDGVIVLGKGAIATESNQIVLSTANVSFRNIGSTFEIGTPSLTDNLTVYGAVSSTGIVNTNTGFRISNAATSGNVLRGNGTNFVSSAIQVADVPTLNQNTTGSAATLTTGRTIAISGDLSYTSPSFNGSTNVTAIGTLATVNSNVGSFTNASVTVNAKGLVTAASSGTAPVTTVTGTSPVVSSGGTTPAISLASGYGDTQNPYASKTQKTFLAAPNAANGVPTFRTILASDVPTLDQNTTGSAATLTTGRSLWGQNFNGSQNITGSLTGVGNITGSAGITIQTGSDGSNLTLIATSTGDIQLTPGLSGGTVNIPNIDLDGGTINGTSIGLSVPASGVFTGITVAGNVNISGNLFVSGSATQIDTANLVVQDPIIFLAEGNAADTVDIGFTAAYNHGELIKRHTGFVRNNIGGKWTLFSNLSTEILSATQIPFDDPSIVIDTLIANVQGTLTGNVSGVAAQAVQLVTGRTISTTGDVTYTSSSFNGTANVTGTASIANDAVTTAKILNSNVTYAKIQNVQYDTILGRKTSFPVMGGGQGVVEEITCTSAARDLLDDVDAAAQRNTLGVGSSQSVTFGEVIVNNGTRSVLNDVYNTTVTSTNVATLATFATASYNSTKYTVQIKQGTTRRAALEIIATKDNGTWEGTVYGIIDQGNIFTNVEISVTGSTVDLVFTFNGNANYTVTAYAQAISD